MRTHSLELDLALDRTEDGCFVQVRRSPAGQGETRFQNPFSPRDLERFWTQLGEVRRSDQPLPEVASAVRTAGQQLFEAVFRGEVLGCLRASFDLAQVEQATLRIHIDLETTPYLEDLPWEYLYNPERQEYVSLASASPLARYTSLQHRILPLKAPAPLRTLVMAAGPSSYPKVTVDQEWLSLLDTVDFLGASGKVRFERLQKPTLLDLQRRLRQSEYHILHIIGHAVFDKQTGQGQLVFEDEMGRSRLISGQHLGALMRDHYSLRLIVLAGPTYTQVATDYRAFLDVARSLVRRGVAAVVAPQFAIPQSAWLTYLREFYTRLAQLEPVDATMVQARRLMGQQEGGPYWGAPVLFTRCADGCLFNDGAVERPELPPSVQEEVAARLNSLRIRTASREAIARWGTEWPGPPTSRGPSSKDT
ncbi:MAG TPA: CHAT domain-containing protein [Caldilineaceae bacterium]|nr:CHAT domain-containing protein [Caldilineaceae bacterium]